MALWRGSEPLVLASQSKVRRAVLEAAGIPLTVQPALIDERALEARADTARPGDVALLLAREKARTVAAMSDLPIILGADQTLALGAQRFSKPRDRAGARAQLLALRGRTHELHSGIAVVRNGITVFGHVAVASLTMRDFSEDFLDAYLDAAGSAVITSIGGYQLERAGIHLFERIDGDHFTILGLPLFPLLDYFRTEGLLAA